MKTSKKTTIVLTFIAVLTVLNSFALASKKPLKVYILAGQSNMEGHAEVRTFDHIGMDAKTAPMLKDMRNADGNPRVLDDVYISYLTGIGGWGKPMKPTTKQGKLTVGYGSLARGTKIGPEYTFGIYMHKHLNEPILLIKTAWGGKSLHTDFRPPSGGAYEWNEETSANVTAEKKEAKKKATGLYYRLMMEHVKRVLADPGKVYPAYDKEAGYEVAGFVWFQGFNDMVARETYPDRTQPGGYDLYTELLCHLIRDVRKDLNAPKMNFVIGVLGVGGIPTAESEAKKPSRYRGIAPGIRKAMAAPAGMKEFRDSVAAVYTDKYWDTELEELDNRMSTKVKAKMKEIEKKGKLSKDEKAALSEKLINEAFTKKELKILETGKSNQGYHYLGSSKTLGQIGKAFADAMLKLEKK